MKLVKAEKSFKLQNKLGFIRFSWSQMAGKEYVIPHLAGHSRVSTLCVCVCVSAYVSFNPPFPSCSRQGPIFSWSPLNQLHAHAYTHFLTKLISLPLSEQLECKTVHMLCYTHTQSAMIGFCDKVLYCAFNVVDSLRNNVWFV